MSVLWLAVTIVVVERVDYFFPRLSSCYLLVYGALKRYGFPLNSDKWNIVDMVQWCHELLAIKAMAIATFILRAYHRSSTLHNNLKIPIYSSLPSLDLPARPRVVRGGQSANGKSGLV
jgi:hypothetical protein